MVGHEAPVFLKKTFLIPNYLLKNLKLLNILTDVTIFKNVSPVTLQHHLLYQNVRFFFFQHHQEKRNELPRRALPEYYACASFAYQLSYFHFLHCAIILVVTFSLRVSRV